MNFTNILHCMNTRAKLHHLYIVILKMFIPPPRVAGRSPIVFIGQAYYQSATLFDKIVAHLLKNLNL